MMLSRRSLVATMAVIAIGAPLLALRIAPVVAPVMAQTAPLYPTQMVKIIVPFSAGSVTDILARAVGEKLADKWKQQVIIENKPGLGGTASVAKVPGDGYTLMLTSNGHTVISHLNKSLNFDPVKDFTGVSKVASLPVILTVPPDSAPKTVKEVVDLAKSKPGQLNYSSAGLGSASGLAAEVLKNVTGTSVVHVPFKGMPEAQTAVLRGDVQLGFTFFSVGGDLIQSGKLRGVAVTGDKRLAGLPDVPTFREAGLPEFNYDPWFGLMVPSTTPAPLVAKISQDIADVLKLADLRERFEKTGVVLASSTPEDFAKVIASDTERYGKILPKPAN